MMIVVTGDDRFFRYTIAYKIANIVIIITVSDRYRYNAIWNYEKEDYVLNNIEKSLVRKQKTLIILVSTFLIFIITVICIIKLNNSSACDNTDVNIKEWREDFSNNSAYDLVMNSNKQPVFKNSERALEQVNIDCKAAISALMKSYDLDTLSEDNLYLYSGAINSECTGEGMLLNNSRIKDEIILFGSFLDIYENSF